MLRVRLCFAIEYPSYTGFAKKHYSPHRRRLPDSLSYVSDQLSLLGDALAHMRRGGKGYEVIISNLRRAIEADRFGIVAHVLAERQGCAAAECQAFSLLNDSSRVSSNLAKNSSSVRLKLE
jgi:hypothetical protein